MLGRAAEHLEDAYNAGTLHSLKEIYEEVLRTDVADDKSRILLSAGCAASTVDASARSSLSTGRRNERVGAAPRLRLQQHRGAKAGAAGCHGAAEEGPWPSAPLLLFLSTPLVTRLFCASRRTQNQERPVRARLQAPAARRGGALAVRGAPIQASSAAQHTPLDPLPLIQVEQGAAPIAEGDRAGCIWLHVPVLVGEATGVTMLAVADYLPGNKPTKEEIDAMPRFTENELTEALFGRGDGQGSALGL